MTTKNTKAKNTATPTTKVTKKQTQSGGKSEAKTTSAKTKVEAKAEAKVEAEAEAKTTTKKNVAKNNKAEPKANKATKRPEVENVIEEDAGSDAKNSKQRYFKLIYNDEIQGRYCGKKPKQAANKAFSSIIKELKKNGNQTGGVNVDINFSIKECTRNSKHKEYKYVGKRESLENPVKVEINNSDGSVKEITYNYFNKLQKAPKE